MPELLVVLLVADRESYDEQPESDQLMVYPDSPLPPYDTVTETAFVDPPATEDGADQVIVGVFAWTVTLSVPLTAPLAAVSVTEPDEAGDVHDELQYPLAFVVHDVGENDPDGADHDMDSPDTSFP